MTLLAKSAEALYWAGRYFERAEDLARGIEAHKGGTVMKVGDALDSCITSWLAGSTQTAECQDAGPPTVPPPAAGHPAVCQPGP